MLIDSSNDVGTMINTVIAEETDYDIEWVLDAEGFRNAMNTNGFWPPDLILLDVNSLDGDYKEVLRSVVSQGNNCPPIIVMSGWSPAQMQRVVQQVHPGDTIVKPFDLETLLNSIRRVLDNRAKIKQHLKGKQQQSSWQPVDYGSQ
jgi:DNA-binding response OmpR family regulator